MGCCAMRAATIRYPLNNWKLDIFFLMLLSFFSEGLSTFFLHEKCEFIFNL